MACVRCRALDGRTGDADAARALIVLGAGVSVAALRSVGGELARRRAASAAVTGFVALALPVAARLWITRVADAVVIEIGLSGIRCVDAVVGCVGNAVIVGIGLRLGAPGGASVARLAVRRARGLVRA